MVLRNGISLGIRKKHIRIGYKFDCVEGVKGSFSHIRYVIYIAKILDIRYVIYIQKAANM